ncbi:hypothetical protein [Sphingomonas astaxanthinifaciens]|uniref:Uncharacterized protein n=1 Tax=Sphingomonas astaxanthinifaciens DSM 22298 TaxID=1123267 RepID=A0ABQ5Z3D1_9SPHN|nr:hypothetical protein [Sphingomonas astaxanthinifaciens]GLR47293.1 hypothetical protein GCM10007925_10040 [Sphingomonas astaxanthinifaciens DSM 22298]
MIHFQPEQPAETAPYAEAVARLRSVRQALALVEMFEGRPRRDPATIAFEELLPLAPAPVQRCVDGRSIRAAGAAAAGIEALLGAESAGETPNPAALDVLGESLRRDLAGIEALFAGRA